MHLLIILFFKNRQFDAPVNLRNVGGILYCFGYAGMNTNSFLSGKSCFMASIAGIKSVSPDIKAIISISSLAAALYISTPIATSVCFSSAVKPWCRHPKNVLLKNDTLRLPNFLSFVEISPLLLQHLHPAKLLNICCVYVFS